MSTPIWTCSREIQKVEGSMARQGVCLTYQNLLNKSLFLHSGNPIEK